MPLYLVNGHGGPGGCGGLCSGSCSGGRGHAGGRHGVIVQRLRVPADRGYTVAQAGCTAEVGACGWKAVRPRNAIEDLSICILSAERIGVGFAGLRPVVSLTHSRGGLLPRRCQCIWISRNNGNERLPRGGG